MGECNYCFARRQESNPHGIYPILPAVPPATQDKQKYDVTCWRNSKTCNWWTKSAGENVEQMEVVKTRENIFRWKVKKGWLVDICLAGYVISQGVIAASDNIEVFEVRIEAS